MSNPPRPVLEWAANQIAPNARVVKAIGLHKGSNPWLLRVDHTTGPTEAVLRVSDQRRWPTALANEATALHLASTCDLPAPRLIAADLDGHDTGISAVLQTALPGNSSNPRVASDERLAAYGAAGARLHAVSPPPGFELLHRTHPIPPDDHALGRRWAVRYRNASGEQAKEAVLKELQATHGWPVEGSREGLPEVGTTPLLLEADERLRRLAVPVAEPVLVHGDLHQANMMWQDDTVVGLVDLGSLGVGHYGVDLGYMRMSVAIEYGLPAADIVLDGWHRASRRPAVDLPYFDVVASLNTPADLADPDKGAPHLDPDTANGRRDAFLLAALERLG